ncbi:MAG: M20/M25/M40 family metallo-hydrolase [Flavobacteriia bacterium]|nr:M20/M25/M40 family metallo-hydrolase [Flavobacteriia bacterium]
MEVLEGSKKLIPGVHFLVDPACASSQMTWQPKLISIETALNSEKLKKEISFIKQSPDYNAIALNFSKYSKDTLKLVAGLAAQLAEIMPVIEVTNQKFTWSVAQNQLKYPFIQVQDSIFKDKMSWDIHIEAKFLENYTSRNVIACKKGKKGAKTIIFSAHYDHLGQMGSETYFPGANDNASGTAMLLSMAKYFKENPNDYTIIFIAFAGEEAGLLGSHYFVEHPLIPLEKINFLINLDIMGSGEEGITVVNATKHEKEYEQLVKINEDLKLLTQVKKRGPAANSDHYWFAEKEVPAIFIYTQGPNKNYHDIFDKYEALSFQEYEDIKTLLVKFVLNF